MFNYDYINAVFGLEPEAPKTRFGLLNLTLSVKSPRPVQASITSGFATCVIPTSCLAVFFSPKYPVICHNHNKTSRQFYFDLYSTSRLWSTRFGVLKKRHCQVSDTFTIGTTRMNWGLVSERDKAILCKTMKSYLSNLLGWVFSFVGQLHKLHVFYQHRLNCIGCKSRGKDSLQTPVTFVRIRNSEVPSVLTIFQLQQQPKHWQ